MPNDGKQHHSSINKPHWHKMRWRKQSNVALDLSVLTFLYLNGGPHSPGPPTLNRPIVHDVRLPMRLSLAAVRV